MSDFDPTDPQEVANAENSAAKKSQHFQQIEEADFRWLMGNKRGRRIVWRLLERAGVFRLSFTANSMQTSFNEGARSYGLSVLAQLHQFTPELYPLMLKEQKEHDRSADDGRRNTN